MMYSGFIHTIIKKLLEKLLFLVLYFRLYKEGGFFFGADRFKSWCLPFFGVFFGAGQNLGFLLVHEVFYLVLFSVGALFGVKKNII